MSGMFCLIYRIDTWYALCAGMLQGPTVQIQTTFSDNSFPLLH